MGIGRPLFMETGTNGYLPSSALTRASRVTFGLTLSAYSIGNRLATDIENMPKSQVISVFV
jgi:hypothetical protein